MLKCGFFHNTADHCGLARLASWCLAVCLLTMAWAVPNAGAALDCTKQPTCEALGYEKGVSSLTDGNYLVCPFDSSYVKVIDCESDASLKTCAELGFTTTDKSSWCAADKIIPCYDPDGDASAQYTLCSEVSCEKLGYTQEDKTECTEDELEKCPFDETYTRCPGDGTIEVSCADLGFTTDDKTAWCAEEDIIKCSYDETYTLCKNATQLSCVDMGFTTDDKSEWCAADSLISCPYDETYTLCSNTSYCPVGWATKVGDCGKRGNRGWQLDTSVSMSGSSCHPCVALDCPEGTSTTLPKCEGDETVSGMYYSGDALCLGCVAPVVPNNCPAGTYKTYESCMAANSGTSGQCLLVPSTGCYEFSGGAVVDPCSGLSGCEYCTCMNKKYLCPSGCSDTDITGLGGASACQMCGVSSEVDIGDGDDSGSGGSGGGSGGISPCDPPNEYSCECKLYKDPYYCVNGAGSSGQDQGCCENFEEEDHTDDDITRPV